jgi:nicotinate phosphoribosyltransferase
MTRLPVATFEIPASEIRRGYRSAIYFNRAKHITSTSGNGAGDVLMQVFQKNDSVLCGMDEAIAVLKVGAGRWKDEEKAANLFDSYMDAKMASRGSSANKRYLAMKFLCHIEDELDREWESEFDQLIVDALHDGDQISPWETVMHIGGDYSAFAHLESVYLGVLARRTLVATNTRRVVEAANGKDILFFADRFDHWSTQGGDGYAAHIGGAKGFASDAMAAWWGEKAMGTMPHALIAFFGGNTVLASQEFHKAYPDTNLVALVDFKNDCVGTAVKCLHEFGDDLYGVRLDTSENMVDQSLLLGGASMGDFKPTGVNPRLVEQVRKGLDLWGGKHVKIIVSGGFNPEKIAEFEAADVPVDSYAVGSSLLRGATDFTADVVVPVAKAGRWLRHNDRLSRVQ